MHDIEASYCTVNGVVTIADPMLGALASNGGATQTHALLTGSPAINADIAGRQFEIHGHRSRSEAYDLDRTIDSRLANISTRGLVSTGDNVMIGGAIILGNMPANVLVRGIGPSLAGSGIPNPLPDPTLELHDGNGALLASNDNWRSDQEAEIIATTIPPTNDLESAILRTLAPGSYTAILRGNNNSTGVAVVEAYRLQ